MNGNNYPKLHNATWPGVIGKGPDSEPAIPFDTMLAMTAAVEIEGIRFDGIDIGLFDQHVAVNSTNDDISRLADKVSRYKLAIGSLVAPVWSGCAMGSRDERAEFVEIVRRACQIGQRLRSLGVRTSGVIRIDSASSPRQWEADPAGNTRLIARTFREACDVAADYGEQLAAEGEICWGGLQSWRTTLDTLEAVDRPNLGFQADMAHTLLYLLGYNRPQDRILPETFDWSDRNGLTDGLKTLTAALRPWTIDFHVAQNDGTTFGYGSHDKTGRHCLATDPNGKLDVAQDAGHWLRGDDGQLTKVCRHICWDGCMFPNDVMTRPQTWNDILATMIQVRHQHGWREPS